MTSRNYVVLILYVMLLSGCVAHKPGTLLSIAPIDINTGITMETNDDVTWRRYTFKDVPLTFMFADSIAPVLTYGDNHSVKLDDIFFTPEIAVRNGEELNRNYHWNLEYFSSDQLRSTLTAAYLAKINGRRYVACSFTKNRLSTLPYEDDVHYLIDITDEDNIKAIAFPDVNDDGGYNDFSRDMIPATDGMFTRFKYYSALRPAAVGNAVIKQDKKGDWVIE